MPNLPKEFQTQPTAFANFDAIEIISGTGKFNLFAGSTVDDYLLSNFEFWSDAIGTTAATGTQSTYTQIFDIDFDVLINKNTVVQGLTMANIPMRVKLAGGTAGNSATMKVNVLVS